MISDKFLRYALPALLGLYGFLYSFFVPAISLGQDRPAVLPSSVPLQFLSGERVAFVGNSLAERMNLWPFRNLSAPAACRSKSGRSELCKTR